MVHSLTPQCTRSMANATLSAVSDYQTLQAGVAEGVEAIALNPNQDGIKQITAFLRQHPEITTIHIVSHGAPGCLYLGNSQLNLDNISKYADLLQHWQSKSILLYGCNVAAGDVGEEFIRKLHQITKANIRASATKTGNAALGGNWQLEVSFPVTDDRKSVVLAFCPDVLAAYSGILALDEPYLVSDINATTYSSNPSSFINVEGILYFTANNDTNGFELYKADPSTGVVSLIDINAGSGSSSPTNLTNVNGTLYFQANDPTNGSELWKIGTNGTPTRIDLGTGSSSPNNLTNVNGTLYFVIYTPTGSYKLWKIDPSTGTPSIVDIVSSSDLSSTEENNLQVLTGKSFRIK